MGAALADVGVGEALANARRAGADAGARRIAGTTMAVVELQVGAFGAAQLEGPSTLAHTSLATRTRRAHVPAAAAVILTGVGVDAIAIAERLAAADRRADPASTGFAVRTLVAASTAVVGVGLDVDAKVVALGKGGSGRTGACALKADLARLAHVAATTAVVGIEVRIDAEPATITEDWQAAA